VIRAVPTIAPTRVAERWLALPLLAALAPLAACFPHPDVPGCDADGDGISDAVDDCVDVDGDGYGQAAFAVTGCTTADADCDDADPAVHPGAEEACNGIDDDCDGAPGEDEEDADGDGTPVCGGDCDDTDETLNPDAGDGDGVDSCSGDCDDGDAGVHPGADEICDDGVDNDCDGTANGCGLSGDVALADADAWIAGSVYWNFLGSGVAAAGDLDQDGHGDLLVGMDGWGAHVILGEVQGEIDPNAAQVHDIVDAGDESSGWAMAGGADLDGDGIDDLLMGAWDHGTAHGAVFLVSGAAAGDDDVLLGASTTYWEGEEPIDFAGSAVCIPGDLDGDGDADVAVGSPRSGDHNEGSAYLLLSPPAEGTSLALADGIVRGLTAGPADDDGMYAGTALAGAGDVDADGLADLLVGAPLDWIGTSSSGSVYVVPGSLRGEHDIDDAALGVWYSDGHRGAGSSVAGGLDVDGDGTEDALVGAPGSYYIDETNAGRAYLVLGPLDRTVDLESGDDVVVIEGATVREMAGASVALTDLDGDGRAEAVIGIDEAIGADPVAAYLFHASTLTAGGPLSMSTADATFRDLPGADPAQAILDSAVVVAGAGDLDGDGRGDLLLGATDGGVESQGCAFLFRGHGL